MQHEMEILRANVYLSFLRNIIQYASKSIFIGVQSEFLFHTFQCNWLNTSEKHCYRDDNNSKLIKTSVSQTEEANL